MDSLGWEGEEEKEVEWEESGKAGGKRRGSSVVMAVTEDLRGSGRGCFTKSVHSFLLSSCFLISHAQKLRKAANFFANCIVFALMDWGNVGYLCVKDI